MASDRMVCCSCGRSIELNSIYCNWCGECQIRPKRKSDIITVPKPRLLPSGLWHIELRREQAYFTDADPDVCTQQAVLYRAKWLKDEAAGLHMPRVPKTTLGEAIDLYVSSKDHILSPSTIRSYKSNREHRFQQCMDWDIHCNHNWQAAVNDELDDVSPKSVVNAWGLIASALKFSGVTPPDVSLPRVPRSERFWLSHQQIDSFLDAVRGEPCELACLLALHSLRLSELLALRPGNILLDDGKLVIRGSRVLNSEGQLVFKESNKTDSSQRVVPIIIPRLKELLAQVSPDAEWVVDDREKRLYDQVNRICEKAGLPPVGIHGLRHSFASLAYHIGWKEMSVLQIGGWSNSKIVHDIYTHNADLDADVEAMRRFYT